MVCFKENKCMGWTLKVCERQCIVLNAYKTTYGVALKVRWNLASSLFFCIINTLRYSSNKPIFTFIKPVHKLPLILSVVFIEPANLRKHTFGIPDSIHFVPHAGCLELQFSVTTQLHEKIGSRQKKKITMHLHILNQMM